MYQTKRIPKEFEQQTSTQKTYERTANKTVSFHSFDTIQWDS